MGMARTIGRLIDREWTKYFSDSYGLNAERIGDVGRCEGRSYIFGQNPARGIKSKGRFLLYSTGNDEVPSVVALCYKVPDGPGTEKPRKRVYPVFGADDWECRPVFGGFFSGTRTLEFTARDGSDRKLRIGSRNLGFLENVKSQFNEYSSRADRE